jgi:hypothetical protein
LSEAVQPIFIMPKSDNAKPIYIPRNIYVPVIRPVFVPRERIIVRPQIIHVARPVLVDRPVPIQQRPIVIERDRPVPVRVECVDKEDDDNEDNLNGIGNHPDLQGNVGHDDNQYGDDNQYDQNNDHSAGDVLIGSVIINKTQLIYSTTLKTHFNFKIKR